MGREFDDEDDFRHYEDEELAWENYPSFNEIMPDQNSTLLIALSYRDDAEKVVDVMKKWTENHFPNSVLIKDEYENKFLKIITDKEISSSFFVDNCIVTRLYNSIQKNEIIKYLHEQYYENSDFFVEIQHAEEKFKLKKIRISVHSHTGITEKNEDWLPYSFWNFYQGKNHVAKALIGYHAMEMCDCAPTILMFEVFPKFRRHGLGRKIIHGIEHYMYDYGFPKLRLENTKAIPFWRSMDYDIDIDEGEKDLSFIDLE